MYLIGKDIHPTKESKFLTFAFDRMSDVITMNQSFQEENVDKENYFKSAIGITLSDAKPEFIVLSLDPMQANYLKSQPIHHSQQILHESKQEFRIQLELVVNYELIALLLSMGEKVEVIKPISLAQTIKQTATNVANKYSTK
jgi:predicted DNA-binding transcriptional regulator YafY